MSENTENNQTKNQIDSAPKTEKSEELPRAKVEDINNTINKTAENQASNSKGNGLFLVTTTLAMLLAVGALLGVYVIYKQVANFGSTKEQLVGEVDNKLSTKFNNQFIEKAKFESSFDEINKNSATQKLAIEEVKANVVTKIDEVLLENKNIQTLCDKKIGEFDERLKTAESNQQAILKIVAEIPSQKNHLKLLEVLQLQRQALRYLEVNQNPQNSIKALEISQKLLATIDDNNLTDFKNQTQETLIDIRTQANVNNKVIAQEVISLGEKISKLKLLGESKDSGILSSPSQTTTNPSPSESPWYMRIWDEMLREIKTLVIVYPENQPLIPPQGEFFIRQNFALSIRTAYYGALLREVELYQSELANIKTWLTSYVVNNNERENVINEVNRLQSLPLSINSAKLEILLESAEKTLNRIGGE